jgi:prepilin signal peptidase PulO-like enzyme (type II secretory pathway)
MPAIENFHTGLSYLGKVSVVSSASLGSSDCHHCYIHLSFLSPFFFLLTSVVFLHVGPSLPLPQHGFRVVFHEAGGGV